MNSTFQPDAQYAVVYELTYTASEVAQILSDAWCGECPCNINGNDEWLPCLCKYCSENNPQCPEPPGGVVECWKEYLYHIDMKKEYERIGFDEFIEKYGKP